MEIKVNSDLKDCPFCGEKPKMKITGKNKRALRCGSCLAGFEQKVLRYSVEWLEAKLVELWNLRVEDENRKRRDLFYKSKGLIELFNEVDAEERESNLGLMISLKIKKLREEMKCTGNAITNSYFDHQNRMFGIIAGVEEKKDKDEKT